VTHAFALPDSLAAKADPALIASDELHFAAIAASLDASIAELSARLDAARKQAGGSGQGALERDLEIHRITARLRALNRFGIDVCLGRIVYADTGETVYIGRLGLVHQDGRRLLVDWRSPVGDPGFEGSSRIRSVTPELSKGLEFDLVVLVDPETFGTGIEGAVDRYVAMTRATQRLAILTG
jgi:DNA helicase IV